MPSATCCKREREAAHASEEGGAAVVIWHLHEAGEEVVDVLHALQCMDTLGGHDV